MKHNRHYRSPDGLDWRDPDMPCIRDYKMTGGQRKIEVDPDYEHRYREMLVSTATQPSYRRDPTYNLNRKAHNVKI